MSKLRTRLSVLPDQTDLITSKRGKIVPHAFVLEALGPLSPFTRPLFGCLAIYVDDRIVLALRDKPGSVTDNGVWLVTDREHHDSLRGELPSIRSISLLGTDSTGWQVIPTDSPTFEEESLRACELICGRDPRIGKIPKKRAGKSR